LAKALTKGVNNYEKFENDMLKDKIVKKDDKNHNEEDKKELKDDKKNHEEHK